MYLFLSFLYSPHLIFPSYFNFHFCLLLPFSFPLLLLHYLVTYLSSPLWCVEGLSNPITSQHILTHSSTPQHTLATPSTPTQPRQQSHNDHRKPHHNIPTPHTTHLFYLFICSSQECNCEREYHEGLNHIHLGIKNVMFRLS